LSKKYPESLEEFIAYVKEIESQPHSYESIADALTDATVAFFNYFASKQGMTGFQASWSGLQFLRKIRGMEHPFMIVDGGKLLYPQYDLHSDLEKFIEETKPQLKEAAKENLEKVDQFTSKNVVAHWKELASL
jgi:ADP-heptose:LPS heptosyltransferase